MTTRVDIEKENYKSIQFPDICPVCGKNSPNSHTKIRTYFAAIQPLKEKMGNDWGLVIPVCRNHKKHITLGRIISAFLFLGLTGIGALLLYVLWFLFGDQGTIIDAIVAIIVIGSMIYAHGKLYSAPLLIESFSYRLLFTFKIDDLAIKFARLNNIDKVFDILNQDRPLPEEKKT